MGRVPMTQFQFHTIMKIIESGAPALASELCGALNNLVNEYNALREEKESSEVVEAVIEAEEEK